MIEEIKIIPIKLKKEQINRYSNIKIYGESLSLDKLKKQMKEYRIWICSNGKLKKNEEKERNNEYFLAPCHTYLFHIGMETLRINENRIQHI